MEITIHNVEAGCCHEVLLQNGARYLFDAGQSFRRAWWPSVEYFGQRIDRLIVQNLDEDHVADFDQLIQCANVRSVFSNPTVTAPALRLMKPQGMRAGVEAVHRFLGQYWPGHVGGLPYTGDARVVSYWNAYGADFSDTNNLSVVTFVSWGRFTILFGADMAERGWTHLLEDQNFRSELPRVNVYVASHHGRDDGRCDRLMRLMQPDVVIFSDGSKKYATQETTQWYRERTHGIVDLTRRPRYGFPSKRYVLTTRNDGKINIQVRQDGKYTVFLETTPLDLATSLIGEDVKPTVNKG